MRQVGGSGRLLLVLSGSRTEGGGQITSAAKRDQWAARRAASPHFLCFKTKRIESIRQYQKRMAASSGGCVRKVVEGRSEGWRSREGKLEKLMCARGTGG